jgi:pyruvate/2-oxoglutarate dehydrogenase complex dihydrolipoamide acyltransferase (E2) component
MPSIEVRVPDIGDSKDVEVIEVLVKPGDTVALEQALITVESDKASMEIPSSAAGMAYATPSTRKVAREPGSTWPT